jgi:dTMP kinase
LPAKAGVSPCFFMGPMNRFIAFEGIEGCGKTTQIRMAGEYLAAQGLACLMTDEPGGTPLGKKIREMLLNIGPCTISSRAELLLFVAARAQHVQDVILPALEQGKWVLCDRFIDATFAYQGCGRGMDRNVIKYLHDFATACLTPALTILLDMPAEEGLKRAFGRIARLQGVDREDRFEQEDLAFHQRVRDGYLALAAEHPERYRIIDGAREIALVQRDVCRELAAFINR